MKALSFRKVMCLACGHTANKWIIKRWKVVSDSDLSKFKEQVLSCTSNCPCDLNFHSVYLEKPSTIRLTPPGLGGLQNNLKPKWLISWRLSNFFFFLNLARTSSHQIVWKNLLTLTWGCAYIFWFWIKSVLSVAESSLQCFLDARPCHSVQGGEKIRNCKSKPNHIHPRKISSSRKASSQALKLPPSCLLSLCFYCVSDKLQELLFWACLET